jgi:hypothetical protein
MIELLSCGDSLHSGSYSLHSSFNRAVNFACGSELAMIVAPEIGAGPFNIVIKDYPPCDVISLTINAEVVYINAHRISVLPQQRFDSTLHIPAFDPRSVRHHLQIMKEYVIANADERSIVFLLDKTRKSFFQSKFDRSIAARFENAFALIQNGEQLKGLKLLRGLGYGLTPAGDDFIAGYMYALHIMRSSGMECELSFENLVEITESENPIVRSFLYSALQGRAVEQWKDLLSAFNLGDEERYIRAVHRILQMGSTSGADELTGFIIGLENVK